MGEEVIGEIHTSIYLYIIIYIPTTHHSRSQKHCAYIQTYIQTYVPIGGLYHIIVQFLGLGEFRIINILIIVVVVVVMHGE